MPGTQFPVCPTGCQTALNNLPTFSFCEGEPEVNAGEIETIYMAVRGQGFTDWTSATEWTTRLAAASGAVTKIIALTVLGDKPKPTATTKDISGGRKIKTDADHIVNFDIDETNALNHEAIRTLECGGNFTFWYATSGGLMFGGNDGIDASIEAGMIIPRGRGDNMTFSGSISWKSKFTEARIVSPIA